MDIPDYRKWIETLCERNYGVREELDRILRELENKRNKRKKKRKRKNKR